MSKKEVVKKQESAVSAHTDMADWGVPEVSSKDVVIPKILCMQGLSELVVDDKAKMGDFVDSMTSEIIGNYSSKHIEFVPFHLEKIWIISKKVGNDFEFDSIESVTPANEGRAYNEVIDGVEYKNEYCMNFYVLRLEDMSLPYIISFKGMSSKAGRILATQMYVRNRAAGKIPPAYVMSLSGSKDKNDKGTFITLATSVVRESSAEEIDAAFNWYKTVNAGQVKAHEEQNVGAEAAQPAY